MMCIPVKREGAIHIGYPEVGEEGRAKCVIKRDG